MAGHACDDTGDARFEEGGNAVVAGRLKGVVGAAVVPWMELYRDRIWCFP